MTEQTDTLDRSAVLRRTAEQVAEDLDAQKVAEDRLGSLVTDSPAVAQYRLAVVTANNILRAAQGRSTPVTDTEFERWAEAQFWKGDFLAASLMTGSPAKTEEYGEFAAALERLDDPPCSCGPLYVRQPGSAKGTPIPSKREIQRVFVGELAKEVMFIRCDKCKRLSAETV